MLKTEHSETLFPAFPRQFPRKVWSSLNLFFFKVKFLVKLDSWTGEIGLGIREGGMAVSPSVG